MMMKIFITSISIFLTFSLYSEETDDLIKIRFRGSIYFGMSYHFDFHQGAATNHISSINYNPIDYTDEGDPDYQHHSSQDPGRLLGNGKGAVKLKLFYDYTFILPFLNSQSPLFKDNTIAFKLRTELTPVSTSFGFDVTLTPVAFLQLSTGLMIGTGWPFFELANGMGRRLEGVIYKEPFLGPLLQYYVSLTLQFDLAALMPEKFKRWTHIVGFATPKLFYFGLLTLDDNTAFQWEGDEGEDLNGWRFSSTFVLGYQVPVIQDDFGKFDMFLKKRHSNFTITAGMLLMLDYINITHYHDSTISSGGWGSDFPFLRFGPLLIFDLPWNFFVQTFAHWKTEREYTSSTVGNLDFTNRSYSSWYIFFERVAFVVGWNF